MKKNNKKKKMKPSLMYAVIFDLFIKLTDELEEADNFLIEDENEKIHVKDAADHIVNSAEIEEKIKKIWGVNQDLLSGLLIYVNVRDEYFNPKLNTLDLFFQKVFFYNRDILEKIGKKIIKPAFPFINFDNYKKKKLLIRQ